MKLELFNSEATKLWKRMSSGAPADMRYIELELYKKLLNFFQVGDYYYFLFNVKDVSFDVVSPQVTPVLGYEPQDVDVPFFMDCIHPDDRPWFLAFETRTAVFLSELPIEKLMKYKVRYDFRFRKKDGNYIRILHQVAVVEHDEAGGLIRTLGVHTDISQLKNEGKPVMSLIGMEGEPSYLNIDVQNILIESRQVLTNREKQVLTLLIEGKPSKEIGEILHISKQTVDKHRKNMLGKNNLNNTGELVAKAIRQGWI